MNLKTALHHHGKAGAALKAGDHKAAAHHFGHALSALRMSSGISMGEEPDTATPRPKGARGLLSKLKGSDGLLDSDTNTPGISTNSPARSVALSLRGRLAKFRKA
jgi:hypothetical protein